MLLKDYIARSRTQQTLRAIKSLRSNHQLHDACGAFTLRSEGRTPATIIAAQRLQHGHPPRRGLQDAGRQDHG